MDFDCNYKIADALKFTGCLVALFKTIIFAKKIILLFVSQNGKIYKARGLIANCEGIARKLKTGLTQFFLKYG